jgi:hypothetical protein
VVVAFHPHRAAGTIFKQAVSHAVADTFQLDRRGVGAVDAAEVAESAVDDEMGTRGQARAVAA